MSTSNLKPLPISIAPALIQIKEILDGDKIIAVELTNGPETWFYDFNQDDRTSLRLGKFPRKSFREDYTRRIVYEFPARPQSNDEENIKKFIAAGDLVSAQKYILELLTREFGDGNDRQK